VPVEESEPISREDAVSSKEKRAFSEMQRQIELDKSGISENLELRIQLEKLIETLVSERDKEIIRQYYFQEKSIYKIGEEFGIYPAQVAKICAQTIRL